MQKSVGLQEQIDRRDEKIEELNCKMTQLEICIDSQDKSHQETVTRVKDENSKLKKELEFMAHEQNTKELQLSDIRSKLSKRMEELDSLKSGLNSQI